MTTVKNVKLALIQLNVGQDVHANYLEYKRCLEVAIEGGAEMIFTPEVTNIITSDHEQRLEVAAKGEDDQFVKLAKSIAVESRVSILIGSLAFRPNGADKCRNRSFFINSRGSVAAHYDKIHMFDVDLSDTERYEESMFFVPGSRMVVARTDICDIGLTICYDLRFPKLFIDLALAGADIIAVPSAFTAKTGFLHWEVLLRARAIETGAFIVAPAQTGKHGALERSSFGNSMVVAPDGRILLNLGSAPGVGFVDIDLGEIEMNRSRIPSLRNRADYTV